METSVRERNVAPCVQHVYHQSKVDIIVPKLSFRPMGSPLEILNVEQYDVQGASVGIACRQSLRQQGEAQPMTQIYGLALGEKDMAQDYAPAKAPWRAHKLSDTDQAGGGNQWRKRQKLSSDDEGNDEAAKKARGRPQLDRKDDTAIDRRRMQIRMAQRAYRRRKEITISSLERQVNELRAANEQMSNIFINLHDFAVGRDLIRREPAFGKYLKLTINCVLALAKSVAIDDQAKAEEGALREERKRSVLDLDLQETSQSQQFPGSFQFEHPAGTCNSVWSYQIIEDKSSGESQSNQNYWKGDWSLQPFHSGYQIITHAPSINASFGFDQFGNYDNFQLLN